MLDLPDVVDPQAIGELDLVERLLIKTQLGFLAPRAAAAGARKTIRISSTGLLDPLPSPPRKRGPRAIAGALPP